MIKTISVAEAKASLSARIRAVEHGNPVVITRHGTPVAALIAAADFERIERLRAAGPEGGLASLAGGWEGSGELADLVEGSARSAARDTGLPD